MSDQNTGSRRGWYGRGGGYRGWWRGRGNFQGNSRQQSNRGGDGNNVCISRSVIANSRSSETKAHHKQTKMYDQPTPFEAWKLYFPNQLYYNDSLVVIYIRAFQLFLAKWRHLYSLKSIIANEYFTVDFKELSNDNDVLDNIPNISTVLRESPEQIINGLGLALHQMLVDEINAGGEPKTYLGKIRCRIVNFDPISLLKSLRANYYGKFVSIKGTVVRVSCIKPLCVMMAYECSTCSTVQVVNWPDGKCSLPASCPADECRSRTFVPRRSHPLTQTIDFQTIRLQEMFSDDVNEAGRIPRTIDCELFSDLVDSCVPGDTVIVSGIAKVMNSDEGARGGRQKDKCIFQLYIHANSLTNSKGPLGSAGSVSGGGLVSQLNGGDSTVSVEFSVKDLYAIEQIHSENNLFQLITQSLCPAIYGHELVKAGLVLGLFGGCQKFVDDKNRIPVRGDPHILVVGDPGLGKSQMLQAVSAVAPRSVYVCGNTTTTSGLTVTLCKDSAGGDYGLEAGALVLADQGCCCIDEFDKMGNQHQALLEAMEQQSISVAKAGIVCSLPARTAVIAAANPVGGHYNKAKTVSENLRMGSALLSRFDLVFILLDKPDEDLDSMLSEHVMALHAGKQRSTTSLLCSKKPQQKSSFVSSDGIRPLYERLKLLRNESCDPIPAQLLRKYIGYARKYVHPKISSSAARVLQEFYLDLRKNHQTADSTPITTRQLESLIRLTEARARLELREEATEQDAEDVIEIMKYSMIDTYCDDLGTLDFKRSQNGSGMSSKSQAKKFISVLQRQSARTCNSLFMAQELRQIAQEAAIQVRDFEVFLASLNDQGYLLKKGPRVYQLQVTDY